MTDVALAPNESKRRLQLDWIVDVFFRPRQIFPKIAAQNRPVWLTPVLVLLLSAIILILVSGPVKLRAAQRGMTLPPDYGWYTPEQQAQFEQAAQATQGPVFIYVLPALGAIVKIIGGWLVVGGLLHLVLTLLGGRGSTGSAMNLVAWASLPLALRDLVRILATQANQALIEAPGLSGFAPAGDGFGFAFVASLLALVDIYIFWQIVLLVIGVRAANGLKPSKAWAGVLVTILTILALQALVGGALASLSQVTTGGPVYF